MTDSRSAGWLLPDGEMLAALPGEGLPRPPVPPLAQSQPCELGHQVEFGRPHVPEGNRGVLAAAIDYLDVVRAHRLRGGVVDVERPPGRATRRTSPRHVPRSNRPHGPPRP